MTFIRRNATNVADTTTASVYRSSTFWPLRQLRQLRLLRCIAFIALIAFVAYFLACVTLNGNLALTSNTTRLPYSHRSKIRFSCISFLL